MRCLLFLLMICSCCFGDNPDSDQDYGMLMTDEPEKEEAPIIINIEREAHQCPCANT